MYRTLFCIGTLFIAMPSAGIEPDSNRPLSNEPISEALAVSSAVVQATVADEGREVVLSVVAGKAVVVNVGLPRDGRVTEIRMTRWMNMGIALAIEKQDAETGKFTYYWSTARMYDGQIAQPVVDRFLNSEIDYDVAGVVNSQSDSIYISLLRHERHEESVSLSGYVYVNNCPVAPGLTGRLYPLQSTDKSLNPTGNKPAN
jgi:hypothetical protein